MTTSSAKGKTAYEKALDERYGAGFSDSLKKDRTCPKCENSEETLTDDCPECNNSIHFCRKCEVFF